MSKFQFEFRHNKWVYSGRPAFTTKTIKEVGLKHGEHRRHIIPSHLLLAALAGYANVKIGTIDGELQAFMKQHMNGAVENSTAKRLEKVAQFIHSNPANLFPEHGGENSAIGFLAKDMFNLISKADRSYDNMLYTKDLDWNLCITVLEQIRAQGPKGFKFAMAHRIETCNAIAKSVEVVITQGFDRYERLWPAVRSIMYDSMSSLELDLNKTEGMAKQNGMAIELFRQLQAIASGSGGDFWTTVNGILALPQS